MEMTLSVNSVPDNQMLVQIFAYFIMVQLLLGQVFVEKINLLLIGLG